MTDKQVLIIGGGVAGLAAACELAEHNIAATIVEQSDFPGGHAIQYTCKATDRCVKCGACMAEEKLDRVVNHPDIRLLSGTRISEITAPGRFSAVLRQKPAFIDPEKCNGCGICFETCPEPDGIVRGFSKNHTPFYALSEEKCRYVNDRSCRLCQDACPQAAIDLAARETRLETVADAVVLATGFAPFAPESKPYGYGVFKNVVTGLQMERALRRHGRAVRPSDGFEADRIAFIQCVGSRDARCNHLWCSKVCCGSALRMANLIKTRQPDAEISFFYMDVQTFGRDFQTFYADMCRDVRMIRAIPGDVYPADNDRLRITFWDNGTGKTTLEDFDLVVLSVGMVPCQGTHDAAGILQVALAETGFVAQPARPALTAEAGVFAAGAATGPMSITETIASAGQAAAEIITFFKEGKSETMNDSDTSNGDRR